MEKNFVTLEAFKHYDKKIKEYILKRDGLYSEQVIIDDLCPKCGSIIIGDKCENCVEEE